MNKPFQPGDGDGEDGGRILDEPLTEALSRRYLAYALSTISSRALPDVRDGLHPTEYGCVVSSDSATRDGNMYQPVNPPATVTPTGNGTRSTLSAGNAALTGLNRTFPSRISTLVTPHSLPTHDDFVSNALASRNSALSASIPGPGCT